MSTTTLSLLVFTTTTAACFVLIHYLFRWKVAYPAELKSRLQSMEQESRRSAWIFKHQTPSSLSVWRLVSLEKQLTRLLEQANVNYKPIYILSGSLICGFAGCILSVLLGNLYWLPMGFIAAGIPTAYLFHLRSRRRNRMARQLPNVFHSLSRTVKAGQTIPAAMQMIAETFDAPVSEEFATYCDQQQLGVSREESLRDLARRTGNMEMQIFVVALLVQSRTGGDVMAMFENLATMARKRLQFEQRVKALTGEGRMQAVMLIALPIVTFVALNFIAPDYMGVLLARPWLLGTVIALQMIGSLWIQRIIRIEV